MVKTDALSFRVAADTKAALEKAAKDDDRSISSLVERIVRDWLRTNGYLPQPAE